MRRPLYARVADWLVFTGIALFVVIVVIPPQWLLNVEAVTYSGDRIVMVRETPLGGVTADWDTEVLPTDPNLPDCSASGTSYYERVRQEEGAAADDTVTLAVPAALRPCLKRGGSYVIRDRWRVKLFGAIPLRRMEHTHFYECCTG